MIEIAPPFHALTFTVRTTLSAINQYVRVVARDLHREAARNDLEVTGPIQWIYAGMDGTPTTEFKLKIVLPVTSPEQPYEAAKFVLETIDEFYHVSVSHPGAWERMSESYARLFAKVEGEKRVMTGNFREIYLNMDFDQPEHNRTTLQAGVIND